MDNDLGRPSSKTYGNGVTEALTCNIRGQRTGQQVSRGAATLFSTTLRYEDAFGSAGVPSWTGNISARSWIWWARCLFLRGTLPGKGPLTAF
jgi:hypothetical protein